MKTLFLTLSIGFILLICMACSKQEDIRGTFINDSSEEITIDCDYHIRSTNLSGKPFMPNNGNEIELSANSLNQEIITVSFMWDSILSPFAKWDPHSDELSIGSNVYTRKSFANCK